MYIIPACSWLTSLTLVHRPSLVQLAVISLLFLRVWETCKCSLPWNLGASGNIVGLNKVLFSNKLPNQSILQSQRQAGSQSELWDLVTYLYKVPCLWFFFYFISTNHFQVGGLYEMEDTGSFLGIWCSPNFLGSSSSFSPLCHLSLVRISFTDKKLTQTA